MSLFPARSGAHIHPTYAYPNGLDEGPPRPAGRWRSLARGLLWLLALLLALVAAWVLSNWRDAEPQPRPAELAPPQARLPAERNLAYTLMGLTAAADRDPAQVGRGLWAADAHWAQQLQTTAGTAGRDAALAARAESFRALLGTPLAQPSGPPWNCDELEADCVAQYLDKADALAQQRQAMAALGARCDGVVDALQLDKGKAYEELLPADWRLAALSTAGLQAAPLCSRWFHTGAVLAFRQGRKDEAWRLMARSNQLHRALLAGAHTLLAQQAFQGSLNRHLAFMGRLAAQDTAWVAQALPLVASFGAPEQAVRRWVLTEAAFGHAALRDAKGSPGDEGALAVGDPPPSFGQRALDRLSSGLMARRIGWHPERTAQLRDQQWLQLLKRVDGGLSAAVEAQDAAAVASEGPALRWWRNPLGRAMVDGSLQAFTHHLRRQLDLELRREAAALALNAQRLAIAPAARAAWAQQQPASTALRSRMSWSADGRTLSVRSWSADVLASGQAPAAGDRIVINLDRTTAAS